MRHKGPLRRTPNDTRHAGPQTKQPQRHKSPRPPTTHVTKNPNDTCYQEPQRHMLPRTPTTHVTKNHNDTCHQEPQRHTLPRTPTTHVIKAANEAPLRPTRGGRWPWSSSLWRAWHRRGLIIYVCVPTATSVVFPVGKLFFSSVWF